MKSAITQLLTLTFLFLSFLGGSQTSLEGKLTDAKTGDPIIEGNISLNKNGVLISNTESDLDGNYFFSNIKPDVYDIVVSSVGYVSQKRTGVITKPGRTNRLDFWINKGSSKNQIEIIEYEIPLSDRSEDMIEITEELLNSTIITNKNFRGQ